MDQPLHTEAPMPAGVNQRYPRPRICTTQGTRHLPIQASTRRLLISLARRFLCLTDLAVHQYPAFEAGAARHSIADEGD